MNQVVTTVCRFCPGGCAMNVWVQEGRVQKVQGLPEDPRTGGRLCPKGLAPNIHWSCLPTSAIPEESLRRREASR